MQSLFLIPFHRFPKAVQWIWVLIPLSILSGLHHSPKRAQNVAAASALFSSIVHHPWEVVTIAAAFFFGIQWLALRIAREAEIL